MADKINPFTGKPYRTEKTKAEKTKEWQEDIVNKYSYGLDTGNTDTAASSDTNSEIKNNNKFMKSNKFMKDPGTEEIIDFDDFSKQMIQTTYNNDMAYKPDNYVNTLAIPNAMKRIETPSIQELAQIEKNKSIAAKKETEVNHIRRGKSLYQEKELEFEEGSYEEYKQEIDKGREGAPIDLTKNPVIGALYDKVLDPLAYQLVEKKYQKPIGRALVTAGQTIAGPNAMKDYDGSIMEKQDFGFLTNLGADITGNMFAMNAIGAGGNTLLAATDKIGGAIENNILSKLPLATSAGKTILNRMIAGAGRGAVDGGLVNAIFSLGGGDNGAEFLKETGLGALFGGISGGAIGGLQGAAREFMNARLWREGSNNFAQGSGLNDTTKLLNAGNEATPGAGPISPVNNTPPTNGAANFISKVEGQAPIIPNADILKDTKIDIKGNKNVEVIEKGGSYIKKTTNALDNGDTEIEYEENYPSYVVKRPSKSSSVSSNETENMVEGNKSTQNKNATTGTTGASNTIKGYSQEDVFNYANQVKTGTVVPTVVLNEFGGNDLNTLYSLNNGSEADLLELYESHKNSYVQLKNKKGDNKIAEANKMRAKEVLQAMEKRGIPLPKNIPEELKKDFLTRISTIEDIQKTVEQYQGNKQVQETPKVENTMTPKQQEDIIAPKQQKKIEELPPIKSTGPIDLTPPPIGKAPTYDIGDKINTENYGTVEVVEVDKSLIKVKNESGNIIPIGKKALQENVIKAAPVKTMEKEREADPITKSTAQSVLDSAEKAPLTESEKIAKEYNDDPKAEQIAFVLDGKIVFRHKLGGLDKDSSTEEIFNVLMDHFKSGRSDKYTKNQLKLIDIKEAMDNDKLPEDFLKKMIAEYKHGPFVLFVPRGTKKEHRQYFEELDQRIKLAEQLYRNYSKGEYEVKKNPTLSEMEKDYQAVIKKDQVKWEVEQKEEAAQKKKAYEERYQKVGKEYEEKIKKDIEAGMSYSEVMTKHDTDEAIEGLDVGGSHFVMDIAPKLYDEKEAKEKGMDIETFKAQREEEENKSRIKGNEDLINIRYENHMKSIKEYAKLYEECVSRLTADNKKLLVDQLKEITIGINTIKHYISLGHVVSGTDKKEYSAEDMKKMKETLKNLEYVSTAKPSVKAPPSIKAPQEEEEDYKFWKEKISKAKAKIEKYKTKLENELSPEDKETYTEKLENEIIHLKTIEDNFVKRLTVYKQAGKTINEKLIDKKYLDQIKDTEVIDIMAKNLWELTEAEAEERSKIEGTDAQWTYFGKKKYKYQLEKAFNEGKDIPQNVLDENPHLVKKPSIKEALPIKAPTPKVEATPKEESTTKKASKSKYGRKGNAALKKWSANEYVNADLSKTDSAYTKDFIKFFEFWYGAGVSGKTRKDLLWKNPDIEENFPPFLEDIFLKAGEEDKEAGAKVDLTPTTIKNETYWQPMNTIDTKGSDDNVNVEGPSTRDPKIGQEGIQQTKSGGETSTASGGNGTESGANARNDVGNSNNNEKPTTGPTGNGRNEQTVSHTNDSARDGGGRANERPKRKPDKNFRITDKTVIYEPGDKTKIKNNIAAIKTLRDIEKSGKPATKAQKEILVKYVGWGGLSDLFSMGYSNGKYGNTGKFAEEYNELKGLLTSKEMADAQGSTRTAFYTPIEVINNIYDIVKKLGFKGGNILDPSTGTGHFMGALPQEWRENSKWLGIEKDSITGRIAKILYEDSDVRISGFEEVNLPNNYFDMAISNVPFGTFGVTDKNYGSYVTSKIHDYFFIKALDKVKPGGVIAFITATGTMDNANNLVRQHLSLGADLVTAIRLPNDTFTKNAGTKTACDILIFKKKCPGDDFKGESFVNAPKRSITIDRQEREYAINEYFDNHPENVLGTYAAANWNTLTVEPHQTKTLKWWMKSELKNLPSGIINPLKGELVALTTEEEVAKLKQIKDRSYYMDNGEVYQRKGESKVKVTTNTDKIKSLISIKEALKEVIVVQMQDRTDKEIKEAQAKLNKAYDIFVKRHGPIKKNKNVLKEDPDNYMLLSLETSYDKKTDTAEKARVFTEIDLRPRKPITRANNINEAAIYSFNEKGKLDLKYISTLLGQTIDDSIKDLVKEDLIYKNPKGTWEPKEIYLAGDVRTKLEEAIVAAEIDPSLKRNVEALKKIIPEDIQLKDIEVKFGASWVPAAAYGEFLKSIFSSNYSVTVKYNKITGSWSVDAGYINNYNYNTKFGTPRVDADKIAELVMNEKPIVVKYKDEEGRVWVDESGTALARQKGELMKKEFKAWIISDKRASELLQKTYNEKFNCIVPVKYSNAPREIPGLSKKYILRPHQIQAINRIIQSGNTLLAHGVGAGKTLVQICAAMEARRLGIAKKPLWVVPKNRLGQSESDFLAAFPNAKILAASEDDFSPKNIKQLFADIALGDWDCIIIAHSSLTKIPVSEATQQAFIDEQIAEIMEALLFAIDEGDKKTIKQLQGMIDNLKNDGKKKKGDKEEDDEGDFKKKRNTVKTDATTLENQGNKTKTALDKNKRFEVATIEEMGIDYLILDESHEFKNIGMYTKHGRLKGVDTTGVGKGKDLYMKARYITKLHGGTSGLVYATGTPITNALNEVYNTIRMLRPDILIEKDIKSFDSFMSIFGDIDSQIEAKADGSFKPTERFRSFINGIELFKLFNEFADIKLTNDNLNLDLPELNTGKAELIEVPVHPDFPAYLITLKERTQALKKKRGKAKPGDDNHLSIFGDSKKAATDMRLVDLEAEDFKDSKINRCAEEAYNIYKETADRKATQLVFIDKGRSYDNAGNVTWDCYEDLRGKLIKQGVKPEEIAFPNKYKSKEDKEKLFADVNTGKVRILIGTYASMGTGLNVQERLYAIHEVNTEFKPSIIEQAEGRMVRQQNKHFEWGIPVRILRYVVSGEGSFDILGWQILVNKIKGQHDFFKGTIRHYDVDSDDDVQSMIMAMAASTGDTNIVRKIQVDQEVTRLDNLRWEHLRERSEIKYRIESLTRSIESDIRWLKNAQTDNLRVKPKEPFKITVRGVEYEDKKIGGATLLKELEKFRHSRVDDKVTIGTYRGFNIVVKPGLSNRVNSYAVEYNGSYSIGDTEIWDLTDSGFITRLNNTIDYIPRSVENREKEIKADKQKLEEYKEADKKSDVFEFEEKLDELLKEQAELAIKLGQNNAGIVEVDEFTEDKEGKQTDSGEEADGIDIKLDLNKASSEDINSINERLQNVVFKGYAKKTVTRTVKNPLAPPPIGKQKVSKFKTNTWTNGEMFSEPTIQAMIQQINATYDVQTTVDSFNLALDMLEGDFKGTMEKLVSGQALTAEDITAGAIIASSLLQEGKRKDSYSEAAAFLNAFRPQVTRTGQALQAVSNWQKLSAEGVLLAAAGDIQGFQKEIISNTPEVINGANEAVDTVKKVVADENAEVIDDVVENVKEALENDKEPGEDNELPSESKPKGATGTETGTEKGTGTGNKGSLKPSAPGKNSKKNNKGNKGSGNGEVKEGPGIEESLVKRIKGHTFSKGKRMDVDQKLLRTLYSIAKGEIDPVNTKVKDTPETFMKAAIEQREYYEDIWVKAKTMLQEEFKGDTEKLDILNAYFEKELAPVFFEKDLRRSILNKIKANNINLNKLVRQHYTKLDETKGSLEAALSKDGFTEIEINYLRKYLEAEFDRLTSEKKRKILAQMFKPVEKRTKSNTGMIKKIVEMSNLGGFNDPEYKDLVWDKLGIPVLNEEDIRFVQDHIDSYEATDNERQKAIIYGQIKVRVAEKRISTVRDKLLGGLRISMLLNPKTILTRNVPGNIILSTGENVDNILGTPADKFISSRLGTDRTTTIPSLKAQVKGFKKGLDEHLEDRLKKTDTRPTLGKYEIPVTSPFPDRGAWKVLRFCDNLVTFSLGLGDRPFYEGGKEGQLEQFRKLNKGGELTEDQINLSTEVGLQRTYQNKSKLNSMAKKAKEALNGGDTPKYLGFGDVTVPFTMTLTNMLDKKIDYLGVGIVKALSDFKKLERMAGGGKPPIKPPKGRKSLTPDDPGKKKNTVVDNYEIMKLQKKVVDEFSRGLLGIMLLGIGVVGYKLGHISKGEDKNQQVRALKESLGIQDTALVIKDKYYSIDFLEPLITAIMTGANLAQYDEDDISYGQMLVNVANNLFSTSLFTGVQKLFGGYDGNMVDNLIKVVAETPSMFVPTLFKQLEQTIDENTRYTYSDSFFGKIYNSMIVKIPVLAQTLPEKVDIWGNEILNYDGNSHNPLRTFLQPNFTTKKKNNVAALMALEVYEATGETGVIPPVAPKSIKYKNKEGEEKNHKLTGEERMEYQKICGQGVSEAFNKYAQSRDFKFDNWKTKAKRMKSIVSDFKDKAKYQIFENNSIQYEE